MANRISRPGTAGPGASQEGAQDTEDLNEIDSDKENAKRIRKAQKGVLRGINSKNILTPARTQHTIENNLDTDKPETAHSHGHRYGTRTAKNGRACDTYDKYDMKVSEINRSKSIDRSLIPPSSIPRT